MRIFVLEIAFPDEDAGAKNALAIYRRNGSNNGVPKKALVRLLIGWLATVHLELIFFKRLPPRICDHYDIDIDRFFADFDGIDHHCDEPGKHESSN
jgi:hypothetical protein